MRIFETSNWASFQHVINQCKEYGDTQQIFAMEHGKPLEVDLDTVTLFVVNNSERVRAFEALFGSAFTNGADLFSGYLLWMDRITQTNLDEEFDLQETIKQLIKQKLVNACHDVSDGGLIVALTESAMPRGLGFEVHTDSLIRKDAFLFGEAQGRVVVSVAASKVDAFTRFFEKMEVDYLFLGKVSGKEAIVDGETYFPVAEIKELYNNAIEKLLD